MIDASYPQLRAARERVTRDALASVFADQQFDVVTARRVLGKQWDDLLAGRLLEVNMVTATLVGERVAAHLPGDFSPENMRNWLVLNAGFAATGINDSTRAALDAAEDDDATTAVFDSLIVGAGLTARTLVTTVGNFGARDAAEQAGGRTKTWTGGTTRHGNMNGETVALSENFSNGMAQPGDPAGGAAEVANCGCSLVFN